MWGTDESQFQLFFIPSLLPCLPPFLVPRLPHVMADTPRKLAHRISPLPLSLPPSLPPSFFDPYRRRRRSCRATRACWKDAPESLRRGNKTLRGGGGEGGKEGGRERGMRWIARCQEGTRRSRIKRGAESLGRRSTDDLPIPPSLPPPSLAPSPPSLLTSSSPLV